MATPKLKTRGKSAAPARHIKYDTYEPTVSRPEVKIVKCIGFQKFRYCGENRPGKKYQDKDFLQLALIHLSGKNVKVQIVCFDAERQNEIHPNGLVGRDCDHGVYTRTFPVSKTTQIVRIPYLRTERILTKKTGKDGTNQSMADVFTQRAAILPSPFKEMCETQSKESVKYDTTRVCFGIICSIEGEQSEPIFCLSNVVQNASEKTMLSILKLSTDYVSAQEGGLVDIFTSEDGPTLTAGKCSVHIQVEASNYRWESKQTNPSHDNILYKRVVSFRIPAFEPNPALDNPIKGSIVLSCTQSGQACTHDFYYEPGADSAKRLATMHSNKPPRKRPYIPSPDEYSGATNGSDVDIKMRMKEKINRSRQSIDTEPARPAASNHMIQANVNVAVPHFTPSSAPAPVTTAIQDGGVPLHQQDDLVMAHDLQTGEIVYIRTQGLLPRDGGGDVVIVHDPPGLPSAGSLSSLTLLSDAPRAVSVPMSEWSTGVVPTTSSIIRYLDATPVTRKLSTVVANRRSKPVVSPWIVDEPKTSTPLMNGDIPFNPSRTLVFTTTSEHQFKQEPVETGPPILSSRDFNEAIAQGVTFSLPSNVLLSNTNMPSITGLFSNSMFEDQGGLLSASVFEMVQPYIERVDK